MNKTSENLIKTEAFKVSNPFTPFWYTSGKIGFYYINAQYLLGNQKMAESLLFTIDNNLNHKTVLPILVFEKCLSANNLGGIYFETIKDIIQSIIKQINVDEIDFISGGERRDWFFSNLIAHFLNKPHVSIFKDKSVIVHDSNFKEILPSSFLKYKKGLHIADLLNTGSSYTETWLPSLTNFGAIIPWTFVAVDRDQGDAEILRKNMEVFSLFKLNPEFFETLNTQGHLTNEQLQTLQAYYYAPDETMRDFLLGHPDFIKEGLSSNDSKIQKRAKLLIEKNWYNIN